MESLGALTLRGKRDRLIVATKCFAPTGPAPFDGGNSRNGRRSGLTFAPEGGSERLRRVINKTVSKDDLIRSCKGSMSATACDASKLSR